MSTPLQTQRSTIARPRRASPSEPPPFDEWEPSPKIDLSAGLEPDTDAGGLDRHFEKQLNEILSSVSSRGIKARLAEGYRTPQKQDEYYSQGRTKPGPIITYARGTQGRHTRGLAADIDLLDDADKPLANDHPAWKILGEEAQRRGLVWGGSWSKLRDLRHIESRREQAPRRAEQPPAADLSDLFDGPQDVKPAAQQRPRRASAIPSPTPSIDLSAGLENDDLLTGLGQTPTPQQRRTERHNEWAAKHARQSAPPLQLKTRPQFGRPTSPQEQDAIRAGIEDYEKRRRSFSRQASPQERQAIEAGVRDFERGGSERIVENTARASADFNGEEYRNFLLLNRSLDSANQRDAFITLKKKQAIAAAGSPAAAVAEEERKQRVAQIPTSEKIKQAGKGIALGLAQGGESLLKSIAVVAKKIDFTNSYEGKKASDLATYQAGEYVANRAREILQSNPDLEQEFFVGKAPQAVGQSLTFLLGGWATKAPKLAVVILGAGMSTADAYDEVKAHGGTDDEAINAGLLAGAILGPSELIGTRGLMKAVKGTPAEATLRAALIAALREGRRDAVENGLQELAQEYVQGKITGVPRDVAQLLEAASLGAVVGAGTTPVTVATQIAGRRQTLSPSRAAAPTPEPAPAEPAPQSLTPLRDQLVPTQAETEKPATVDPTLPRFTHPKFGEVVVLPDQTDAGNNRYRVAEVANPDAQHFAKKTELTAITAENQQQQNMAAAQVGAIRPIVRTAIDAYIEVSGLSIEEVTSDADTRQHRDFTAETAEEISELLKERGIDAQQSEIENALYALRHEARPRELETNLSAGLVDTGTTEAENVPETGLRNMAQRIENAEARFINSAMRTANITRDQAAKALAVFKKEKIVKIDPVGGQFTYSHGSFAEPDVIRRAAGLQPSKQPSRSLTDPKPPKQTRARTPQPVATTAEPGGDLSLAQFVRKRGGIVPMEMYKGELDRLRKRETGTTGLINQNARQGSIKQTADLMMAAANEAGYRDPATDQPFERPGDFLYAVERDVAGDRLYSTHRETELSSQEFDQREAQYYAEQEAAERAAQARVDLLESGRGAELYDRIEAGSATDAEKHEYRALAKQFGLSEAETEDFIAGDSAPLGGVQEASSPGRTTARAEQQAGPAEEITPSSPYAVQRAIRDYAAEEDPNEKLEDVRHIADVYRGGELQYHVVSAQAEHGPILITVTPEEQHRPPSWTEILENEEGSADYLDDLTQRRHEVRRVGEPVAALSAGQPRSRGPAQQLGFVEEGLRQQEASRPNQPNQREQLIRDELARQDAANPERAVARRTLEEIRRRGLTVDEYARHGDLFGNVPSAAEIKLLRELESREPQGERPADQPGMFGPGAASAREPFPEVKERRFGKRFVEDERIADEIRDIGTARYYEAIPNKVTIDEAKALVKERGIAESITILKDESNSLQPHLRSAMGQLVIQRLNQTYRNLKASKPAEAQRVLDTAVDLAEWAMDYGTRLGQGVQSFAVWSRLTPEGMLLTYKRATRKARERQQQLYTKDVSEIVRTLNKDMTDAERAEALKKLFKTNETARKIKTELDKLIAVARTGKLTDALFYELAGEKLGLPGYNKETANRITDLAMRIDAAPEGLPRNKLVQELQHLMAAEKGFDVSDLPMGIYYGNILSGYNTHAVNFADTLLNVVSEINGLAMVNPRAAAKIYSGLLRGLVDGRYDAMLALTQGRMVTDGKWLEVPRLMEVAKFGRQGGVPIRTETRAGRAMKRVAESQIAYPLNAYKYVTRAMAASDAVMFRGAKEARSTLLAHRMAEGEGLKGDALEVRVQQILALDRQADFVAQAKREGLTGTEAEVRARELREMMRDKDLSADAAEFAGEATYNHKPHGTLGMFAEWVGSHAEEFKVGPTQPLKLFVPFTRIVANVTNRGLNWTPYGFKRAIYGWGFSEKAVPLSAEGRRQMLMRATVGTVGMVLLGVMNELGFIAIHGNGPSDREKRLQMLNTGWRPYSLQIGDAYISYQYSPVGLGLAILGNMKDATRYHELQQKDASTRAAYAVARVGSTIFSQSFLSGLTRLFDALSDDSARSLSGIKRSLGGIVSGFTTPNIARDIYRLFDNKTYESNTLMEDLIRNTPLAAIHLKPTLNAFGEPVKLQRQRFFDIQTSDPAWQFVIEKGLNVPFPSKTIEMEKDRRITPDEYYELVKTTGPKIKDWIIKNRARLSKMKEQDAQDELRNAASRIRQFEMVRMRMFRAAAKKRAA